MAFIKYLHGSLHHHFLYLFDPSEEFPLLCNSHGFFMNHTDKILCASLFSLPTFFFFFNCYPCTYFIKKYKCNILWEETHYKFPLLYQ